MIIPKIDRVFYLAPVKGFKYIDLTRNIKNGELIVNAPDSLFGHQIDDSLYTNPIEYNSCSIETIDDLNCTGINLSTGYVKVPHSNNYNFNDQNFTICFWVNKSYSGGQDEYQILGKSRTQTVAGFPPRS